MASSHAIDNSAGVYAPAILRFHIAFPIDYPDRPPGITFSTDIFHPLITPLTTYTYSTQDSGADTVSASDQERLPPGGFSLRHAFPQWPGWHHASHHAQASIETTTTAGEVRPVNDFDSSSRPLQDVSDGSDRFRAPHILEVLFYLRSAFTSEAILDSIPLGAAANSGAWHAWQSFRARTARSTTPSTSDTLDDRSSLKQQPGGAKRPGEWNWEGVWEDRVSRGVKGSLAEHAVFASPASGEQMVSTSTGRMNVFG